MCIKEKMPLDASLNPTRTSSSPTEMAGSSGDHLTESKRCAGLAEPKMWGVYVLRLNCDEQGNPRFYVGMTNNLWNRLHNHARGNDRSSKWVLKCGYVKVVEAVYCDNEDNAKMTESAYTLHYKTQYGWDHVRGSHDVNPNSSLRAQPTWWDFTAEGREGERRERSRSRSPAKDD